jgi:hypothetical protein
MKVRINNKPNAKQKKVLKEECRKEFHKLLEHYNRQVALQVMNILHFDFGFGEKRLRQFFFELKEMQARYIERYEVEDDDVPDICEIQLREAGINIDDILEVE